jgi:hypothetical protein
MGSAMARKEHSPLVPGTLQNKSDLRRELQKLSDDLGVEGLMKRWSELTAIRDDNTSKDARVFLVTLHSGDYRWQVRVKAFRESDTNLASEEYLQAEKDSAEKHNIQVALVSVESIDKLSEAYPNYYQDTLQFLKALQTELHGAPGDPMAFGRR